MEAATVQDKFLVRNNTAGWVGVVKLNYRGEEVGEPIEPYGTIWLTELEMMLTARAPRLPEDNPFEEQTLIRVNPETQTREEFKLRPLTVVRDSERYTPAEDRYVPTVDAPRDASPASSQEAVAPQAGATRPTGVPLEAPPPVAPSPAPPGPAQRLAPEALPGTPQAPEEQQSWVQPPPAPGEVLPGSLRGSDEATAHPERAPQPTDAPTERFVPSIIGAQAAPQTPGEEHAQAVDPAVGEETGQAKPPVADQPEGEWAWAEEVGSPEAPTNEPTQERE